MTNDYKMNDLNPSLFYNFYSEKLKIICLIRLLFM